jgi:hypothetical protein
VDYKFFIRLALYNARSHILHFARILLELGHLENVECTFFPMIICCVQALFDNNQLKKEISQWIIDNEREVQCSRSFLSSWQAFRALITIDFWSYLTLKGLGVCLYGIHDDLHKLPTSSGIPFYLVHDSESIFNTTY